MSSQFETESRPKPQNRECLGHIRRLAARAALKLYPIVNEQEADRDL